MKLRQHALGIGDEVPERRRFTQEFKTEAVALYRSSQRPIREVASELGIAQESLRRWAAQNLIDKGIKPGLSTDEREELGKLRRRVRILEQERDILKKAAAFFANETQ